MTTDPTGHTDPAMTLGDTARVLAAAAAIDQRRIGPSDVETWHRIAQHATWDTATAMAAVIDHYTHHTRRVTPADITRHHHDPDHTGHRRCDY